MTYAIIRTGGKQFRAEAGKTIRVPKLAGEAGAKITFDDVILGTEGDKKHVGTPSVKGAHVTGEIVKQGLGEKIVVFKQKRRKNYARKQGHRQPFTEVRIKDVAFGKSRGGEKGDK
ncbi:MAG TPA: 50S ribosomal protein L21 [Gemmatimonadaceae bacterium]|nr:50S ribosomal protein L21 [Gemmatimonadaceae bacterium]